MRSVLDCAVAACAAALAPLASGQVTYTGEYRNELLVTLQIEVGDIDDPSFVLATDLVDFVLSAKTETTLASEPVPGMPLPEITAFSLTEFEATAVGTIAFDVPPFVLNVTDFTLSFADSPVSVFVEDARGPGRLEFQYSPVMITATGGITLEFNSFPIELDLLPLGAFDTDFRGIIYELFEEDGAVRQRLAVRDDALAFRTNLAGISTESIRIQAFPSMGTFTTPDALRPLCDPAAFPVGVFGGDVSELPFPVLEPNFDVADADGDGFPDVVLVRSSFPDNVSTLLNDGAGSISPTSTATEGLSEFIGQDIAVADADGDTIPDVAYVGSSIDGLHVRIGNGDGTFGGGQNFNQTNDTPESVTFGDLDGDNRPEIIVSAVGLEQLVVYDNDGSGTFTVGQRIATPDNDSERVVIDDFNGDTWNDVATTDEFGSTLVVYLNDGAGTLMTPTEFPTLGFPDHIASGDIDGDLDNDIVVTDFFPGGFEVLLNNGDGTFGAPVAVATSGASPTRIVLAHLNDDTHLDAALSVNGSNSESIAIHFGDGAGGFSAPQVVALDGSPRDLHAADLNLDGRVDLVTNRLEDEDAILVFYNGCRPRPVACSIADIARPFEVLDAADAQTFVAAQRAESSGTDYDASGSQDFLDLIRFLQLFDAGCP